MLAVDAWLYANDGDGVTASRLARQADDIAATTAWRVWTLSLRASIAAAFNEAASAMTHAEAATEMAASVDWNVAVDEERVALLRLAEVYAAFKAEVAPAMLERYSLTSMIDRTHAFSGPTPDIRLVGWETYVRGLVTRCRGDFSGAKQLLSTAAEMFHSRGFLWREALALIELDATPGETRGRFHLERAATIVRENFPHSFLARRLGRWGRVYADPIAGRLRPSERDVLRRLLDGASPKQIAETTNRSIGTVQQYVKRLHAAFGTHAERELFAACYARGLGSPAWPVDPQDEPAAGAGGSAYTC